MNAIYEPKGAAREYAELACNLYAGCSHGCLYCYAPGCLWKTRETFRTDIRARSGILDALARDADKMAAAGNKRRVLFCFTSDPYQPFPPGVDVTREALQIMADRGLNFEVCTKGGLRAERDFDLLRQGGRLGVSLVWTANPQAAEWEPNAATPGNRGCSLLRAHHAGLLTWVSVEPVIDPSAALDVIRWSTEWVDEFRVGKINHNRELEATVDWQAFVDEAYPLLVSTGKRFMFKESLWPYLRGRSATGGLDVAPRGHHGG